MHVPCWFIAFNCDVVDIGLWMLWQLMHDTLRASCWLPFHNACTPLLWQVVQVALTALAEILLNRIGLIFSGSLACASPGPWHDSHPCAAAGVPGCLARPCLVALIDVSYPVWQVAHTSVPTYPACGVAGACAGAAAGVCGAAGAGFAAGAA